MSTSHINVFLCITSDVIVHHKLYHQNWVIIFSCMYIQYCSVSLNVFSAVFFSWFVSNLQSCSASAREHVLSFAASWWSIEGFCSVCLDQTVQDNFKLSNSILAQCHQGQSVYHSTADLDQCQLPQSHQQLHRYGGGGGGTIIVSLFY